MELLTEEKKRFKKTEVGLIPEDWDVKPLGDILTVKHGKSQKSVECANGVFPILGTGGILGKTNTYLYDKPSVLIGRKGTIDKPRYIEIPFWTVDTLFYTEIEEKYLPKYIYYFFNLINWYSYNEASGVPSLNSGTIEKINIPLPPTLAEQQAIATALSDVDELIRSLDGLIQKKEAIKKGTMQQLLTGKKRLPGFDGEWEVKKLGELLTVKHGKSQKQVESISGDYPILATGGQIGKATEYLYNKPSVLIGRKGTIDRPQYIDSPFWTIDTLFYTDINEKAIPKFIYYKFLLIDWRSYNEASGVPSLNSSNIENIVVIIPNNKEEQKAIVEVLTDMESEIQALRQKREKAGLIKQGMMQELLTGRIRIHGMEG